MRFLILAVGSRGDAEPFCALAHRLDAAGQQVDLFLQSDMQYLVPPGDGITAHSLPFTMMDFYQFVASPSHGADGSELERFIGVIADVIGELVLPQWESIEKILMSNTYEAIVTSSLARNVAFSLSEKYSIPSYLIHLQPLAPTDKFPQYRDAKATVDAIQKLRAGGTGDASNAENYWENEKTQFDYLEQRVNKMHASLSLPPLTFERTVTLFSGHSPNVHIVNAFDNEVMPKIERISPAMGVEMEGADGKCRLHELAALADDYTPPRFTPPPELEKFLESKPVCIGFGSMPVSVAAQVHEAVKELDVPTVLVGDALAIPEGSELLSGGRVFHVASAPYSWLLPKCRVMVSHGGAGVVHAALRAGVPLVIAPLLGDQFFWAAMLCPESTIHEGLGGMTSSALIKSIRNAMLPETVAEASAMGKRIRARPQSGCEQLVDVLTGGN